MKPWQQPRNKRNKFDPFQVNLPEDPVPSKLLDTAKTSGILNLTSRGLTELPSKVYNMYKKQNTTVSLSYDKETEDSSIPWWDIIALTKLILSNNEISELSDEIEQFESLKVLDLHHNKFKLLPTTTPKLQNLENLYLNHNEFNIIPSAIFQLNNLTELTLNNNFIHNEVPTEILQLKNLTLLNLANNKFTLVPSQLSELANLRKLFLNNNKLTEFNLVNNSLPNLIELDLSFNAITHCFSTDVQFHNLTTFKISGNQLKDWTVQLDAPNLKELALDNNSFTDIAIPMRDKPQLSVLNVRKNQLAQLPDNIFELNELYFLDIGYNNLTQLDPRFGNLEELKTFNLDGNLFKNAPRYKTVEDLKRLLRARLSSAESGNDDQPNARNDDPMDVDSPVGQSNLSSSGFKLKLTQFEINHKYLNFSNTDFTFDQIEETLRGDLPFPPSIAAFSKLNLTHLPPSCLQLTTLIDIDLSNNKLTSFPLELSQLPHLKKLNLTSNSLTRFPTTDDSSIQFNKLEELNLSLNQISGELPQSKSSSPFPCLIHLNLSNNKITAIHPKLFEGLSNLDLSNNDINMVPPELGLVDTLTTLNLMGNSFRIPRYQMLQQGTKVVMEYLKSRVAN